MKTELLKDITNNKEEGEHLPWLGARPQPGSWGRHVVSWERELGLGDVLCAPGVSDVLSRKEWLCSPPVLP